MGPGPKRGLGPGGTGPPGCPGPNGHGPKGLTSKFTYFVIPCEGLSDSKMGLDQMPHQRLSHEGKGERGWVTESNFRKRVLTRH